jgi:hypothetical protein
MCADAVRNFQRSPEMGQSFLDFALPAAQEPLHGALQEPHHWMLPPVDTRNSTLCHRGGSASSDDGANGDGGFVDVELGEGRGALDTPALLATLVQSVVRPYLQTSASPSGVLVHQRHARRRVGSTGSTVDSEHGR